MIDKRAVLAGVLIAGMLAIAGCSSSDGEITLDGLRKTATNAGPAPTTCPIPYDISAALPDSPQVKPGDVEVQVSKSTTPAPDPLAAQRDQGMSALDAAAGVSINCDYEVNGKTVATWLVATPTPGAPNIMGPSITRAAHITTTQLADFLKNPPDPGEVKLTPTGTIAIAHIPVNGSGDATLMLNPDGLITTEALTKATKTLLSQIHIS
ncbi:hypothetical protein [Actinocrispum sp. NPDC049592]|uniref:hypothetical protein n=1 Tax=Actinocrispum sp. NPDC049592 TaxID=3154835 RepID=UPI00342D6F36